MVKANDLPEENGDESQQLARDISKELKKERSLINYIGKRKKGQSRLNYAWSKFVELAKRFFGFSDFRDVINSELKKNHRRLARQNYEELYKKKEFAQKFPHFRDFMQYVNASEARQKQYSQSLTKLMGKIIVAGKTKTPNGLSTYCPVIMHDFLPRFLKETYGSDRYKIFFWSCGIGASLIFIGVGSITVVHAGDAAAQILSDFLPFALFSIAASFILAGIFVYGVKAALKRHIHKNAAKEIAQELKQENAALSAIKYFEKNEGIFAEIDEKLEEKFHFTEDNDVDIVVENNRDSVSENKDAQQENENLYVEYYLSEKDVFEIFGFTNNNNNNNADKDEEKIVHKNVYAERLSAHYKSSEISH